LAYHGRTTVSRDLSTSRGGRSLVVNRQITSNRPLGSTNALRRLIELGRHVKVRHLWLSTILRVENNEGVDLEVRKVQVHIDAIQTNEEINEGILLLRWDVGQEGGRDDFACRERLSYRKVEYEGLCVDVADVYAAFVGEEDGIAFTSGCDADVVFGVGGMGKERLNDKVVERSRDRFDLRKKNQHSGCTKTDHVI
jgi:hypothetical protein